MPRKPPPDDGGDITDPLLLSYMELDDRLAKLPDHRLFEILGLEVHHRALKDPTNTRMASAAIALKGLWMAMRAEAGDAPAKKALTIFERAGWNLGLAREKEAEALAQGEPDNQKKAAILRRDTWSATQLPPRPNLDQETRVLQLLDLAALAKTWTGHHTRTLQGDGEGKLVVEDHGISDGLPVMAAVIAHVMLVEACVLFPQHAPAQHDPLPDPRFLPKSAERARLKAELERRRLNPSAWNEAEQDLTTRLKHLGNQNEALRAVNDGKGPLAGAPDEAVVRNCLRAMGLDNDAVSRMLKGPVEKRRKLGENSKTIPRAEESDRPVPPAEE